jgi:glucose/arabinose dehydrogenase
MRGRKALPALALLAWAAGGCLLEAGEGPASRRPYGIERWVPWDSSRLSGSPDPPPPYRARRAFPRLKFNQPLYLSSEPRTGDLLVVELPGRIHRFPNRPDPEKTEIFLDIRRDTYSLVFHPRYLENGLLYLFTNGSHGGPRRKNIISRFRAGPDLSRPIEAAGEEVILEFESDGHNGGDLAFGPDGFLYISAGDGTSDSDGNNTGQDLSDLPSAILRIDVDHREVGNAYRVPEDNPFREVKGARPEIWAFGLRNPWRIHFDPPTGKLWVGDVGQDLWEMVYLVERGGNYGWSVMEGAHPFHLQRKLASAPVLPPVLEHPHAEARSITGGLVYRGSRLPALRGAYLYGDYSTGRVWALRHDGKKLVWSGEIARTAAPLVSFGSDGAGELYLVDHTGRILELEPAPRPARSSAFPTRLSEAGLFLSLKELKPAPALIPYSVNSPLWSDGARKERWMALPPGARIGLSGEGGWSLPDGSVLVKNFSLDLEEGNAASRRRVETRLLIREEGEWQGYSYAWNAEETDALLLGAGGLDRPFTIRDPAAPGGLREQSWHYPSRAECMVCHSRAASFLLGITTRQLNREHDYGGVQDNQIRALEHLGLFEANPLDHLNAWEWRLGRAIELAARGLPFDREASRRGLTAALAAAAGDLRRLWSWGRKRAEERPGTIRSLSLWPHEYQRIPDPYDPAAPLEERARSYLHSNCSHCHVAAGGGNSAMELGFQTARDSMNVIGVAPQHDCYGIERPLIVAPGDPERSLLYRRVATLGPGRMPPLASSVVDRKAQELLRDWIDSLASR